MHFIKNIILLKAILPEFIEQNQLNKTILPEFIEQNQLNKRNLLNDQNKSDLIQGYIKENVINLFNNINNFKNIIYYILITTIFVYIFNTKNNKQQIIITEPLQPSNELQSQLDIINKYSNVTIILLLILTYFKK